MNIIDLATKTMQTAIKSVVDAIKTVTDATKVKVDTIDTNVGSIKTTVDATKAVVDSTKVGVDTLLAGRVVKSVQKGIFLSGDTPATLQIINISPIDGKKSFVVINGVKRLTTGTGDGTPVVLYSLNSTSIDIRADGHTASTKFYFSWQVIEFY